MKIYSCPDEVPPPVVDYDNYDHAKVDDDEAAHMKALSKWLKTKGYTGKHTGEIYREGVADGYARYMVMDGRSFGLVHLPYGDGYQSRDVQFLPKKEIIRRLGLSKKMAALFAKA